MVIKRYTIEVSGHSIFQNLGLLLTRSALKWKDEQRECLPQRSAFFVDLENLEIKLSLLTISNNGIYQ